MKMEENFQVLNLLDAGERICQVKEELRRTRIKAKRFRVGWMRLPVVGGRGRKRRAKGMSALLRPCGRGRKRRAKGMSVSSLAAAVAAKAEQEI